jgi:RNA polymerase sigma-32 factor
MTIKFSRLYGEEHWSHYVAAIKDTPLLGKDEEFELAIRWKENGDRKALDKLVKSHLRLVAKIATGYSGYGLSQADLMAEGNIGIMQALQHFDPAIGYRFSTYAIWWIKARIRDFIYNAWSMVKLGSGKENRKHFFGLRRMKQSMGLESLSEENVKVIADKFNVSEEDVIISDKRFTHKDFSINSPRGDEGSNATLQDFLITDNPSQEELIFEKQEREYRKKNLHEALNTLSKKEYDIVCARRLQNPTSSLSEIAKRVDLSAERVRQIELKAFLKIQKYVRRVECRSCQP